MFMKAEVPKLEDQDSVKAWLKYHGITFEETVVPPEVPRPYNAVMATRLASKLYLDPRNKGEERQKQDAEEYFKGLETLREKLAEPYKEYVWQFERMVKNHGSRLADTTSKVRDEVKKDREANKGFKGKMGEAIDYLGFRGLGSFLVYDS